jgi:lipopolysaccharide/colanic/teichoic acid biosynthesis glycosyltransferase
MEQMMCQLVLTGWAQINGRDELELEDKARLDGEYSNEYRHYNGYEVLLSHDIQKY